MTQKEKDTFFVQYWGQKVGCIPNNGQDSVEDNICRIDEMAIGSEAIDHLLLTPLSMITDEDRDTIDYAWETWLGKIHDCKPWVIDFLRGNGYAVDWTNSKGKTYTVEEMVEDGWIKLKEA